MHSHHVSSMITHQLRSSSTHFLQACMALLRYVNPLHPDWHLLHPEQILLHQGLACSCPCRVLLLREQADASHSMTFLLDDILVHNGMLHCIAAMIKCQKLMIFSQGRAMKSIDGQSVTCSASAAPIQGSPWSWLGQTKAIAEHVQSDRGCSIDIGLRPLYLMSLCCASRNLAMSWMCWNLNP